MSAPDIEIDRLRLDVSGVEGQERRIGAIAERAAALFAGKLEDGWCCADEKRPAARARVNLSRMTDEEAARAVAEQWLRQLALKLAT